MKYAVSVNGVSHEVEVSEGGVRVDGELVEATFTEFSGSPVGRSTIDGQSRMVDVRRGGARGSYTLWVDGFRFDVEALDERTATIRAMAAKSAGPKGPAPLHAPMPGLVVRVNVKEGDAVVAGQGLVVIEAMKMENELRAQTDARVRRVHVEARAVVEKGALLIELE